MYYGYNGDNLICGSDNRDAVIKLAKQLGYEDIEITNEEKPRVIPLEELKQTKIREFKNKRDALEVEPIEYDGHLFDFDDKARDRINAAIIALQVNGEGTAIEWTLADNTNTLVTYRDLMGVVANVASRSDKLHIKYRELKEKILAATTKEELDNIQWEE